jgi:hypothetical protein
MQQVTTSNAGKAWLLTAAQIIFNYLNTAFKLGRETNRCLTMGPASTYALGMLCGEMALDAIAQTVFSGFAISNDEFRQNKVAIMHLCVVRSLLSFPSDVS